MRRPVLRVVNAISSASKLTARHVSFAKTYLAEVWPTLTEDDRQTVIESASALVAGVVELSLDAAVYDDLGIAGGIETARSNPNYQATVIAGLAKLTTFLGSIGVIDDASRANWEQLGLVGPISGAA